MKILAIDYMAIMPTFRALYAELAKYPDLDLAVLVPEEWEENFTRLRIDHHDLKDGFKVLRGVVNKPYKSHRSIFLTGLRRALKVTNPDIIFLNMEPETLFVAQTILYRQFYAQRSRLVFYTYRNIDKVFYKFGWIYRTVEKFCLRTASYGFSANSAAIDIFKKKGFTNMAFIPQGVDIDVFSRKPSSILRSKLNLDGFIIGYVGRLVKEKGVDLLVKAIPKLEGDVRALIIGSGPEKDALSNLAHELMIADKVRFLEAISHAQLPEYLSCIDTLVLPSRTTEFWKEQFGKVLIEAMSCEVCVVGSDSGEIPFIIDDAGLIFSEGDVNDLVSKLSLILKDVTLRTTLARKGRQRVLSQFTWRKIAEDVYHIFRNIGELNG